MSNNNKKEQQTCDEPDLSHKHNKLFVDIPSVWEYCYVALEINRENVSEENVTIEHIWCEFEAHYICV